MTIFYLVRHAHAEWTPDENRQLSVHGFEDAQCVADMLQTYHVHEIYSSPARRAYQIISPLAERTGIPIKIEADLRERKLGDQVFEDFLGAMEATWQDPFFAHPVGEPGIDAQRRGLAVLKHLQSKGSNKSFVLSTHGNLIALILQAFDPSIDFSFWKSLTMPDVYNLIINSSGEGGIQRVWGV